ncbi:CHAT domain-containing protein [Calothrix sp. 336/3]|uniref:CHAT domain-containing protein n=1 Tax=Calothrix sp. 336/3 TaxID=1337936 RepID=UPI0030D8D2AA
MPFVAFTNAQEQAQEKNYKATLLRCLEMSAFNPQYFQENEREWMAVVGILDENHTKFHPQYLANIGKSLFQALFPADSKVKNILLTSLGISELQNTQLHIQLEFSDTTTDIRLADYPWELLHDDRGFLLLDRNITISRYIAYESIAPNLLPTEKINVLLLSSNASDADLELSKLGDSEVRAIRQGLATASREGRVNFVQLPEATTDKLRAYLTEHRGEDAPQVLHFDGHGLYGKRCTNPQCKAMNKGNKTTNCRKCGTELPEASGYLVFEDGKGGADYVSAKELAVLLSKSSSGDGEKKPGGIGLVVLSACQSAMTLEGESVFNGTAQGLIGQRIPAVVAMQYSVSVVAAAKFAEQFYRSLGQKNSLGIAVSQAREAMGIGGNQWYRPVLYLRWEENQGGQLFNLSGDRQTITYQTSTGNFHQDQSNQNQVGQTKNQQQPSMKTSRQKQRLQDELTDLHEERDASYSQYRSTIDDAQKIVLKRKIDKLDNQINDLENQINNI